MLTPQERALLQHLSQYITDNRKQFIDKVLEFRTRQVTVVMEDMYQPQNASAVVRTCEGMGLQEVHVVENKASYEVNKKVLKGANKWIDIIRYKEQGVNNMHSCLQGLKQKGYKILATSPAADGKDIAEIDPTIQKCALVVGNELNGLSSYAVKQADEKVRIPMYGFMESFNVSVSVAVCLTLFMQRLRAADHFVGLTEQEKEHIKLTWYRKIVKRSDIIEREFMRTFQ